MKKITWLFYLFAGLVLALVPAVLWYGGALKLPFDAPLVSSDKGKVFNAAYDVLDNGLEIVVIENHRAPVVTHMVWYKVGAADAPAGQSGLAHFMEHLMFKGSDGLAPGAFSETVRSLGGNDNAFTSQDYTAYFQSIAKEHLSTVMRMEAGRMRGMNPPEGEVRAERRVVLEERAQRTDNNPLARFAEQLDAALYTNHPYGRPVIGWRHEIEKLTRADAMAFYDGWYAPNNAILVVSGAVTGDEVFRLARDIYGQLDRADVQERRRTYSPPLLGSNTLRMRDKDVHEPSIAISYRVPRARQNAKESLALEILADILGGGPSARLYKALVVEQKIASHAALHYRSDAWDDGEMSFSATPAPGQNPENLRDAFYAELRTIITNGISADTLHQSRARLQADAIYARDSLAGPAMIVGRALATGQSLEAVETWPQRLEKISAQDIQDAARRYLNPDAPRYIPPVVGYLLPLVQDMEGIE